MFFGLKFLGVDLLPELILLLPLPLGLGIIVSQAPPEFGIPLIAE